MLSNVILRSKALATKGALAVSFVLITLYLFVSDSFISKIYKTNLPSPCILCSNYKNISNNSEEIFHFSILSQKNSLEDPINLMVFFVHAESNPKLELKLSQCVSSLFNHSSQFLHVHILTDHASLPNAIQILQKAAQFSKVSTEVTFHDVNILMKPLQDLINSLRPHFSFKQGAYYSDGLFYVSIGLFKVTKMKKVILIDADVIFLNDVKELHDHFKNFSSDALIGIAREQQPVYRHVLHEYRRRHNNTKVGDPPPDGFTGFNSGVLLLDLDKMRNASTYLNVIDNSSILVKLIEKYKFKGHLGDQDFYTLISFEYPSLFYILPCTWNRQLCQWWKSHGYKDVFSLYQTCKGNMHLLHGNCNTPFPDSRGARYARMLEQGGQTGG